LGFRFGVGGTGTAIHGQEGEKGGGQCQPPGDSLANSMPGTLLNRNHIVTGVREFEPCIANML
jgi:hypothetical protein